MIQGFQIDRSRTTELQRQLVGCESIFPSGSLEPSATESEIPPLHKSENLCKGEFRPAGGIERLRRNLAEEHILLKKLFIILDAENYN